VAARSRYVKLKRPALTAHVLEAGRGEPVVLLHGGGAFACQFASLMSPLEKEFRILAADRPGCGLTDKFDYRETVIREHAVGFVGSLLDALDLPKATLVGHSMGGLWAMQFALAKPDRVTKLVLIGEPAGSPRVPPNPPPPWPETATFESIRTVYATRLVVDARSVPDELVEVALASRRLPGARVSWNTLIEKFLKDKKGAWHLRPELKNLRTPTLYIWGDKDQLGPPSLGEEMAKLAPNARCEVLRDAGHNPWLDHPDGCSRLVIDFLKDKND